MALSKNALGFLSVLILLGIVAGATYLRLRPEAEVPEGSPGGVVSGEGAEVLSAQEQFNTEIPQPVSGEAAVRDTLRVSVTAAGQAEAIRRATLTARVSGVVAAVPVRENRTVGQGQLLVQVDTTEYALAVSAAEAAVRSAEVDYQTRVLFNEEQEESEAKAQRDRLARAVSGLDQATVELRRAQFELAESSVTAPFGGRVADLLVVPGHFVREGDELLTVVDLDPIKVEVQVLEAEVGFLTEGRGASLTFAAFPSERFTGAVETINPVVDPETRTARVTVHIPNRDGRIKPGMYAEVRLEAEQFPDRILVPKTAILERDRRNMLFVFEDGRAKWRYVTTGLENDTHVELVEGDEGWVAPGEIVLVDGHHYLTHDAAVRLVEDPEAEGGRPSR
ncbi:MAG: efflux RND transporter periplasmic adaptor subunit [Gemmatimonadota bacterium]|nr:efflux RND transporter periplasmic adaptor subunit [Gemmatimonadota bacterium]